MFIAAPRATTTVFRARRPGCSRDRATAAGECIFFGCLGSDAASGLAEALAAHGSHVVKAWQEAERSYVVADGLFGRASSDPNDVSVLEHEAKVRELVGTEGPLRSPPIVDRGPGWMLEQRIEHGPAVGEAAVGAIAAAAARIAQLRLPGAPRAREDSRVAFTRRIRALLSPLSLSHYLSARRVLADLALPDVTSHGDFHAGNVLVAADGPWVVDWELSGLRPAGHDLMTFWPTLERPEDRERLFELAVDLVGRRPELLRLRYALTVRTVASFLAGARDFDRDETRARELLGLLPGLRSEAGI
jgi:Phosphotransferase enzyme family